MRNVLLFIDNVEEAEGLVRRSLKLAQQCKANLLLCNVAKTQVNVNAVVYHSDDDVLNTEDTGFNINELSNRLNHNKWRADAFIPAVNSFELNNFSPAEIREMVISHNVWLIIMDEKQLNHLKNIDSGNPALKVINNINCPVLLIPQHTRFNFFNKIVYVTDLRYCDLGVIKFLKIFNAQLFVTHISAPGLPDMEERYAQEILAEEISVKTGYPKMFLRNIRNKNTKDAIDKVLDSLGINLLAFVNKKHQTFERLFDNFPEKTQIYHRLPTLIFPYLNWFNKASFYSL